MKKTALVTGATAGFGWAIAQKLVKMNYRVICTGRRQDRLDSLTNKIKTELQGEALSLCFDIRDNNACIEAFSKIPKDWHPISVLINNAGLAAGADPIHQGSLDDWEQMIDTNVKGLLYISKLVMPEMIEEKNGHIINLSSIAGVEVYPTGNVYCASKHAVQALTKGMRIDLLPYNIKVSSICPAMAETEFSIVRYHGDAQKATDVYKGLVPLNAEDIADTVEFILSRPAHFCVNDILIAPTQQANTYINVRK